MSFRQNLKSLIPFVAVAFGSQAADAGPGACVQTLIQIQEAAQGKWLKGILPARVPGVLGRNDVVLFARKDGTYILNEGAKFYVLPVDSLSFGKGKLLTDRRSSNVDGNYGLIDSDAARLITPQGNEVRLHRLRSEKASAMILRGDTDDQARLMSASESLAMKQNSVANLIKTRKVRRNEICEEIENSSRPSLTKFAGSVLTPLNAVAGADDLKAQKQGIEKDINEFQESQVAREKEQVVVQGLIKQAQAATPPTTQINEPALSTQDSNHILDEVAAQFLEKMKNSFVSPTDRKEIKTYCEDSVQLPESMGSETERNITCDTLQGTQKQICTDLSKVIHE